MASRSAMHMSDSEKDRQVGYTFEQIVHVNRKTYQI